MHMDSIWFLGEKSPFQVERHRISLTPDIPKKDLVLSEMCVSYEFGKNKIILFIPHRKKIYLIDKEIMRHIQKSGRIPKAFIENEIYVNYNKGFDRILIDKFSSINMFHSLFINLTSTCNLDCVYCYATHSNHHLDFKAAKAAIDYLKKNKFKVRYLNFLAGGEHTLRISAMKKVVSYARNIFPGIEIALTSNGVFSSKILKWLEKNIDNLYISCDGPPFIQDANRPLVTHKKSSALVEKNIRTLVKDKKVFSLKTTLSPYSIGKEDQIVKYFSNLKVKQVWSVTYYKIGKARANSILRGYPIEQKFLNIMRLIEYGEEAGIDMPLIKAPFFINNFHVCGAFGVYFVLNSQGQASLCQYFSHSDDLKKPEFKHLFIGSYNDETNSFDIDIQKIREIQKSWLKYSRCKTCQLKFFCTSHCTRENCIENNDPLVISQNHCDDYHYRMKERLSYLLNRYLIRKLPCLEKKGSEVFLKLQYSEHMLSQSVNKIIKKNNPLVTITEPSALDALAKEIIDYNNEREHLTFFILDFQLEKDSLNKKSGKMIEEFLCKLKESAIIFRVARPLPACLFENAAELQEKFQIPKNISDSLAYYTLLENGKLKFYNGNISKKTFDAYENREEIMQDFEKFN